MNIDVQHSLKISSAECINCQTCVLNCPKNDALNSYEGQRIIQPLSVIVIVMIVFFGSIFAAQAAGVYELTPGTLKAGGESIGYDEVKGYMSIKEAAESSKTELKEFYKKFKIPANVPAETKMKEISTVSPGYDFENAKESLEELK